VARQRTFDLIGHLPLEIVCEIIPHLKRLNYYVLRLVSRRWNNLFRSRAVKEKIYQLHIKDTVWEKMNKPYSMDHIIKLQYNGGHLKFNPPISLRLDNEYYDKTTYNYGFLAFRAPPLAGTVDHYIEILRMSDLLCASVQMPFARDPQMLAISSTHLIAVDLRANACVWNIEKSFTGLILQRPIQCQLPSMPTSILTSNETQKIIFIINEHPIYQAYVCQTNENEDELRIVSNFEVEHRFFIDMSLAGHPDRLMVLMATNSEADVYHTYDMEGNYIEPTPRRLYGDMSPAAAYRKIRLELDDSPYYSDEAGIHGGLESTIAFGRDVFVFRRRPKRSGFNVNICSCTSNNWYTMLVNEVSDDLKICGDQEALILLVNGGIVILRVRGYQGYRINFLTQQGAEHHHMYLRNELLQAVSLVSVITTN